MNRTFLIGIAGLVFAVGALAQEGSSADASGSDDAPVAETQRSLPAIFGSEVPPLQTGDEAEQKNLLTLGLQAGASYDDNALSNNAQKVGDFEYDIHPSFEFSQFLPRLNWNLEYAPGVTLSQHFARREYFSQRGILNLAYRWSKRLTLRVHGSSSISTNPFDQLKDRTSELGPIDRPNPLIVLPRVKQLDEEASAEADYVLSARSFFGLTGSFTDLAYRNFGGSTSNGKLIDTRTVHGRGYFGHQISRRQTIGAAYDFQDLSYPGSPARTKTHSVTVFDEIQIRPDVKFTIFAGPEHSHLHDVEVFNLFFFQITLPIDRKMWSPTAGADLEWRVAHSALGATYVRRISDGGGLIGAVQLQNGEIHVRHDFSKRWSAGLSGGYSYSSALNASFAARLRGYVAGADIARVLTRNVSLDMRYERVHQVSIGQVLGGSTADHNRAMVTLMYTWNHPLGR